MELKLSNQGKLAQSVSLLIVPYGIETNFYSIYSNKPHAFNRTLWN